MGSRRGSAVHREEMGRLRIAMFGHKRIPSREGGVEVVAEELATRMAEAGHPVTCYNRGGHHVSSAAFDTKTGSIYQGIRLKTVPTIEKKLLGKRVIVTVHGLDWQRAKWGGFASRYIKWGEQAAVRYADEIIVLSESVRQYFRDTYGRETVFIPNGVKRPSLRSPQLIREAFQLEKDGYILFLGRIVPEKGISYLIKAFREGKLNKKLVIAGGSSDTDAFLQELKEQAGDESGIVFTGFVQEELLEELYSNAYIYCLPSDLEGMPLSLLEAMSYGNCCLVSNIPECAEVVEDKAVLFRKGDTADLRARLERLCEHPEEVRRYKEGAADFICGKYNWDKVAESTLALYRKV